MESPSAPLPADRPQAAPQRDRGLLLIAAFKFSKVALLTALGVGALQMLRPHVAQGAEELAVELEMRDRAPGLQLLLEQVGAMSDRRLMAIGVGAFLYAALFLVEGVGLLLEKRWAEYLTVVAGISLIPIELYELSRHIGPVKIAILLVNVAIVWYLIRRLRAGRAENPSPSGRRCP